MRLIDADKFERDNRDHFDSMYGEDCADLFKTMLCNAPTIDAKPIVHAKWIEIKSSDFRDNNSFYKCPLCGRAEQRKEPYCNCGAKMDKEGK